MIAVVVFKENLAMKYFTERGRFDTTLLRPRLPCNAVLTSLVALAAGGENGINLTANPLGDDAEH